MVITKNQLPITLLKTAKLILDNSLAVNNLVAGPFALFVPFRGYRDPNALRENPRPILIFWRKM